MPNTRWGELKLWQKAAITKLGLIQLGLFVVAWRDLSKRSPEQINGSKQAWRAALLLSFIGPLAYFTKGRVQSDWNESAMPDLSGTVAIVTGANSGLGYETTRALVQHGATVIMACRNLPKATRAAEAIRALNPAGNVVVKELDLADLASVRAFADHFKAEYNRLDLLINNAGIMAPPFGTTKQGFETQFGINHLGHFALTAQLIDLIKQTPNARVVTLSSMAHRLGSIDFDDLNWRTKRYNPWQAYGQSKLANLLFTYELQRRLTQAHHDTLAVAAHPGYADTNLQGDAPLTKFINRMIAQPQHMGALPTLRAATDRDVQGGQYFGPSGIAEIAGKPERVTSNQRSHNLATAQHLWAVSEELTGVTFSL